MSLTVDRLLVALEPLSYPDRLKHLAHQARSLHPTEELPSLVEELAGRGIYEQRLAAFAALAGRHIDFLAGRLTDRDPVVRAYALRAARTLPFPDAAIEAAYEDASADARQRLGEVVLASGRTALAERLVPRLREQWGDHTAAKLLPVCSPEFVAAALPELSYALDSWTRMGLNFPDQVLDHAERDLADRPRAERDTAWHRYAEGVAAAVSARAGRVLSLLERHRPGVLPEALIARLNEFVAVDAERTVRLLIPADGGGPSYPPLPSASVLRRIVRADPPSLPALGRHWIGRPHFAVLLKALPPHRRSDFLDLATAGVESTDADDVLPVLGLLQRERRWAEARRWAARRRETGGSWYEVLELVAYGPVAEARAELLAGTRRPDAGDRARAWPLLIVNAARTRDSAAVREMLAELPRLRNEQDPVRHAALGALAEVRPDLFTADSTEPLDRILRDALEARDISYGTREAVRSLAIALLRENAADGEPALVAWSLGALERIAAYVGVGYLGPLDRALRRGQEHQVLDALRPWLDAAMNKADYRLLFTLTASLGRRAHRMPVLQGLLEEALKYGDDAAFTTAVRYWLEPPSGRHERVARILELEPSAAVLDPVERVLTERRTDLLDVLLGGPPPYGRFLKRGRRRPLPELRCAARWLPRQQAAAGAMAAAAADDESQPLHSRAAAIRAAATVPEHGRALALRYAESQEVVLAEAALAALVWADQPQDALPVLLAHVGDDRARVAVHAATRATRFAAPSRLAEQLGAVLTADEGVKVTSRKEAVRLAATRLSLPRAAALLAAAFAAPPRHPDVQATVVAFSAELLSEEETWSLLAAATEGAPQVLQAVVRPAAWSLPEIHRPRYARLVGEVCRSADPEAATAGLRVLPLWARYAPDVVDGLSARVTDLGEAAGTRAVRQAAVTAIGRLAVSGLPHPVGGAAPGSPLHDALTALLPAIAAGEPDAPDDRDLPARQRALALLRALPDRPVREIHPVLEAVAALLADEPSLAGARADVLRALVDPDAGLPELTARLVDLAANAAGRPALAAATAYQLRGRFGSGPLPSAPSTVLTAATRLTTTGDPATGLLAVALVSATGNRLGWPTEWRTSLRALRTHPSPDVRDAALGVVFRAE
ncbi:hypothetical protein OG705_32685 [Streptomyces sp. NBC_00838]|uniref:hypothetical protein n=1 Tax=Streptomyces sp. NBC_00838 TaxID=2903680 RepID=UPI00386ABCA6|nr:hypothetical protein OG705_32685 [Streptomyces sp. NBC_00838]